MLAQQPVMARWQGFAAKAAAKPAAAGSEGAEEEKKGTVRMCDCLPVCLAVCVRVGVRECTWAVAVCMCVRMCGLIFEVYYWFCFSGMRE